MPKPIKEEATTDPPASNHTSVDECWIAANQKAHANEITQR
jgi:hypothetical protein